MRGLSLLLWAAGASSDGGVALGDLPPPVVLTFGPTSGPTLGGTLVTFSGAAFTSGARPRAASATRPPPCRARSPA